MAPTPKSLDRKRKPSATSNELPDTPAKKRAGKSKETVINLDVEDPFNFEKKEDSHPEPLKNISIERTAFGGVKFSRSPPSALQRYVSVEKIAERRGNVSGTVSSPISSASRPGSLSSLGNSFNLQLTPGSANTSAIATPKSTKGKKTPVRAQVSSSNATIELKAESEVDEENLNVSALLASKRRSKTAAFDASATPKEKKLTLDDYCVVPKLTPAEQLDADHGQEHKLLEAGARVLALWGHDYYAANICGRDGLSRYYVHFVEDNLNRLLPPNGVVPFSALKNGTIISFIDLQDDQEIGKQARVVKAPSHENAEEWTNGLFKLYVEDEGDVDKVSWAKIYLTKEQHKVISALTVNTTVDVEQENIVSESRSSRRSRSTRFSLDGVVANNSITPTATPKSTSRSKTPRVSAKTPKTSAPIKEDVEESPVKVEIEKREDEESELKVAEKSSLRSARASKRSAATTPTKTQTPARGRARKLVVSADEAEGGADVDSEITDETKNVGKSKIEVSDASVAENNQIDEPEREDTDDSVTNDLTAIKEATEVPPVEKEVSRIDDVTDDGVLEDKSLNDKMEVDDVVDDINNSANSTIVAANDVDEPLLNGSFNTIQNNKNSDQSEDITVIEDQVKTQVKEASVTMDLAVSPAKEPKSIVTENGDSNTSPCKTTPINLIASLATSNASSSTTSTQSLQSAQNVSISSIPPPSNEQEATIFKDMKFVLTSATRSKKNSDFQKRDYRIKIEERGGEIVDDFLLLQEGETAFLIADTYYRTHKYLSALSISVPCVMHNWILACVTEKRLLDHIPYMLPAGESSLDQNKICEWKLLKGILLRNKAVWVYSNIPTKSEERAIGFVDIWSSIIKNLGATLVEQNFSSLVEKLEYCAKAPVDILLTDLSCEKELAERVEAEGGIAVSSEWVIQAIVTGELPDVSSSERFRFDSAA